MPPKESNIKYRLRKNVGLKATSDPIFDDDVEEKPTKKQKRGNDDVKPSKKNKKTPTCKKCGVVIIRDDDASGPFLCLSCACPSQSQSQESVGDISVD